MRLSCFVVTNSLEAQKLKRKIIPSLWEFCHGVGQLSKAVCPP